MATTGDESGDDVADRAPNRRCRCVEVRPEQVARDASGEGGCTDKQDRGGQQGDDIT
jgi:hypothetical protein